MVKILVFALVIVLSGAVGVAIWVLRAPELESHSQSWASQASVTTVASSGTAAVTTESDSTATNDKSGPSEAEFSSEVRVLSAREMRYMTGKSWHEGCPVPLSDLRVVAVTHWTWEDVPGNGTLIVHKDTVKSVRMIFQRLYEIKYPIRLMEPIDKYRSSRGIWADDSTSIDADNTSAFNCRPVTGGSGWSEHSYGRAIDINPVENPYVLDGRVARVSSEPYIDRKPRKGVLVKGDRAIQAFGDQGWQWGGLWTNPIDYQHFSTTGK